MQSLVVRARRSKSLSIGTLVLAGMVSVLLAGPAVAQKPLGIDVSAWQGTLTQANWNSVYASGRVFAFIRVTHVGASNGDPDTQYVNNFACATNAGLLCGAYNFARPTIQSPSVDAQHFLDYAAPYITTGYLPPVLDLEEGNGTTVVGAANLSAWAVAWLNYVENATGVRPLVYCNGSYASAVGASLKTYNLWFANFTCPSNPQTASPAASYSPWTKYTFWQYCSTQSVPGISGACDMDIFNGTLAELQALVIGGNPPTISNVQATSVSSNAATITWTTDLASTSQVQYGVTSSYGTSSPLDSTQVYSHSVTLSGLSENTLYHYQVISTNAGGTTSSTDYTFTTTSGGAVDDIIIDNPACTFVGGWSTGTSSIDKYGADYRFATTAASETATATFTPTILTSGNYDVYCWYPQGTNRSAMAPYTVYWNGGSQTIPVNQQANGGTWNLLVAAKPFVAGTSGYVKVGNGTGEASKVVMADAVAFVYVPTGTDTQAPTAPTNLAATAVSATQVNLTWTPSTDNVGVEGYLIYRNGAEFDLSAGPSYSDTTCLPNTTYTYTVSAYDAAANESAQSAAAQVTTPPPPDTQAPTVPTNLGGSAVSQTQVNLSWTASTDNVGVTGYAVFRNGAEIGTSATTYYSDTTCSPGTTYTYTVSAYDAAGNESAQSAGAVVTTPGVASKNYAPSAITLTRGTVSSGGVANLAANDSSYLVINAARSGSTRYVDWYSSVTIAEAPASVTKLTVAFDGKLSASLNQRLYLYNWSTSSWTQIDSRTVGTSDTSVSWNTTSPANYISSSGQIRLRQYVTRSSSFTSSSDFARFTVEY